MTMTPRRTWLERLLNKEQAEEVRTDLQQAASAADAAGMERKDLTKAVPEEEVAAPVAEPPAVEAPVSEPPLGDPIQAAALKLAEETFASVEGDPSKLTVEALAAVIASNLQPPTEEPAPEAAAPAEVPTAPEDEEMQADKALSASVSDAASAIVAIDARDQATKALDLMWRVANDQGELAGELATLLTETKEVKAILPVVEKLVARMEALEEQLSLRPRSASEADENVVDVKGNSKAAQTAKAIEADINRGLQGDTQKVLGVRVNG